MKGITQVVEEKRNGDNPENTRRAEIGATISDLNGYTELLEYIEKTQELQDPENPFWISYGAIIPNIPLGSFATLSRRAVGYSAAVQVSGFPLLMDDDKNPRQVLAFTNKGVVFIEPYHNPQSSIKDAAVLALTVISGEPVTSSNEYDSKFWNGIGNISPEEFDERIAAAVDRKAAEMKAYTFKAKL